MSKLKKYLYITIGIISLGLGAIGTVVPMMPAFPFLLISAICFSKSSKRIDTWFKQTKLYKNNLEDYVAGKGMTKKTKVKIMITITLLMSIGFVMMHRVVVGRIVLGVIWLFHLLYFTYAVKTIEK